MRYCAVLKVVSMTKEEVIDLNAKRLKNIYFQTLLGRFTQKQITPALLLLLVPNSLLCRQ